MKGLDALFEDHARRPVPQKRRVTGWHILLINVGVVLTLPAYLTAGKIGLNVGLTGTIVATLAASVILAGVGSVTGYIGAKTQLSTYMILRAAFGKNGAKVTNFVLAATLLGWFGVTAAFFGQATNALSVEHLHFELGVTTWTLVGTALMITTAMFGFKGLDRLSILAIPLLFVLILAALDRSLGETSLSAIATYTNTKGFPVGAAVSMIVGGWMVGAVVMPDLSRYAETPAHGWIGAGASFLCGNVIVVIPCAILAIATHEADIVRDVVSFGWSTWALVLIVVSAWTTNDNNIYSTSLSIASIFERIAKWKITIAAGIAGGALAAAGIMSQLIPFLVALGILVPPVAGIFATDFFLRERGHLSDFGAEPPAFRWQAFVVWVAASGIAYATQPAEIGGLGLFAITRIPALDALLISSFGYFVLHRSSVRHDKHDRA